MKFPFVGAILKSSGFSLPYAWCKTEFHMENDTRLFFVDAAKGVISVTDTVTNDRLITTYFSNLESFCTEMAAAYVWYNK